MAIVNHTTDANTQQADGFSAVWTAIANGSQGDAASGPYVYFSASAVGTFGVGGSVRLDGSNDGVNWFALSAPALTAAGIFAALGAAEHPRFIRPNVTAGDGTTAITVTGFFAAPRRTA